MLDAPRLPLRLVDEPSAIVHDWFQGMHGSERVVEALRTGLFPPDHAPDILTFVAARELVPPELAERIVREARITTIPGIPPVGYGGGRWTYLLPSSTR